VEQVQHARNQRSAAEQMQYLVVARTHSGPLTSGQNDRDQGASTWRFPHVCLSVH
jgi:hypothetical protein